MNEDENDARGALFRLATPADAAALAAFAARTFCETFAHLYPPNDLAAYLAKSYGEAIQGEEIESVETVTLLAFDDAALIGYAQSGPMDLRIAHDPGDLELYRLYVAAEAKGAGVAQALMRRVIERARQQGAGALWLSVWENNERAQRFYRRCGFAHIGEHKFMVGKTADRDFIWRLSL